MFVRETSVNHLCKHCVCVCGSGPSSHAGGSLLITAISLLTSRTDRLLWRLRLVGLAALVLCLGNALGGGWVQFLSLFPLWSRSLA